MTKKDLELIFITAIMFLTGTILLIASSKGTPGEEKSWDEATNSYITKPTCAPSDECACPDADSDGAANGCSWISMLMGAMRPSATLEPGVLMVNALEPYAGLSSPQGLSFILGYGIYGLSYELTSGSVPRYVTISDHQGIRTQFEFKNGESIADPIVYPGDESSVKLMMVDAEGWAVTNEPAYYDLYPGNGEMFRMVASPLSPCYKQLYEYRTVSGRIETISDIGFDVIVDENGIMRQIMAPSRFADIITTSPYKYSVNFYTLKDVELEKGTNSLYNITEGAEPVKSWVIENPNTNTVNELRASLIRGSETNIYNFVYSDATEEWTLTKGDGLVIDTKEKLWNDARTSYLITQTVKEEGKPIVSKETTLNQIFAWGSN